MSSIHSPRQPDYSRLVSSHNEHTNDPNMGSKHTKSQPRPPPPPPPPSVAQAGANQNEDRLSPASQKKSPSQPSASPTNILSSQMFKDELIRQQSRLSPSSDSNNLTIDERIRLRREAGAHSRASTTNSSLGHDSPLPEPIDNRQADHSDKLPDKLTTTSSTLQRDKRPFAYSPDVSDPNNRGKLDLTQIKSSTMRRRLLANMKSSSSGDDEHDQQEPKQTNELTANNLNSASDCTQNQSDPRHFGPNQLEQQQQQQQTAHVHYSADPPEFYELDQQTNGYAQQVASIRHSIDAREDYLSSLDADIAESLDSLSLLVNSLDARPSSNQRQQTDPQVVCSDSSQLRAPPRHQYGPTQRSSSRVSTFKGPATDSTSEPSGRPSFYSVLPSGRQAPDYLNSYNVGHFGPDNSFELPHSTASFYGPASPGDVVHTNSTRCWHTTNSPTSQRTFAMSPVEYDMPNRHQRQPIYGSFFDSMTPAHVGGVSSSHSTSSPPSSMSSRFTTINTPIRMSNYNSQGLFEDENSRNVRALQEMSTQLESETSRLNQMTPHRWAGQRR